MYEYEIAHVGGLYVVSAMGRPQISFPTLEGARRLLREIAGLPFQAVSYWPGSEADPNAIKISMVEETLSNPIAQPRPVAILIELDHHALRLETDQDLHRQPC
jgi:hypothetical protein